MAELRLPRAGLAAFATGSFGMGIWVTVPGLLLLYFLTDILAVTPLLAGATLLIPKIADVVLHPWVGTLSDADLARRGHRRRLLLIGCALVAAFAGLFTVPPALTGPAAAGWVAVVFIAGNLLFAAYQVPYLSTPADLAIGYHERTRLMGFRMVVLTIGILAGGIGAPLLARQAGYATMAAALGGLMLAALLVGVTGVGRLAATAATAPPQRPETGHGLLVALRDRQFRRLTGSYLAMSTTSHLVLAGVPYYAKYALGRPGLTTVLVAAFLAPALVATPVWVRVARRYGKQRGLLAAQAAFVAGCLVLAAGSAAGRPVVVGAVVVLGVAFAALQLLPFSMLPDVVAHSGRPQRAGSYTGVWTATDSLGGALGPYVYAACLALGGFVASTGDETVPQPGSAIVWIRLGFGAVPATLMLVALLLQRSYTLDGRLTALSAPRP
ncbi:MFS transporter [Dactylosporangium matsuzakiense]|uniref:MFS transporter n=1 Tax=Dactylosporangium matsuzakiense TaxID=53360 RepID=A0A9W6NKL4_9ACTN|nr:MFS transporter [Dactylosporangium matsuzakiense]UWZ48834.1 MFS transporter [Dactylosporangium matsuzakiense]GLL01060.1 MFS transporter [Dactylosporangium matsuzakiense]